MAKGICYNPDGSQVADVQYVPCDQYNNVDSMCCATNRGDAADVCIPNGLCLGQYFGPNNSYGSPLYTRESCTDRTWQSSSCLRNICTDSSNGAKANGDLPVIPCSDGTWCCGANNQACCDNREGFSLAPTLQAAETATATMLATATLAPTATSNLISTITATAAPSNSLSHAGIALVTLGTVFLIAAIIGFLFLYRKIRQRYNDASQREPVELDESLRKSEMPVDTLHLPAQELIGDRGEPVELQSQVTTQLKITRLVQFSIGLGIVRRMSGASITKEWRRPYQKEMLRTMTSTRHSKDTILRKAGLGFE